MRKKHDWAGLVEAHARSGLTQRAFCEERGIHPVTFSINRRNGRKNWLFSTSQAGARASANLYSLVETAKANALDPYKYLEYLFTHLPNAQAVEDFEALLPWHVKPHLA